MDIEEKEFPSHHDSNDSIMANPSASQPSESQPCNQFLRLPQIYGHRDYRIRNEPLTNYSHSQILTFQTYVEKLNIFSNKEALVENERAIKQKKESLSRLEGLMKR